MGDKNSTDVSATRLRVGVFLLLLWWIPFWLAAPRIAELLSIDSSGGKTLVTVIIFGVQTVIGIIGIFFAGQQIKEIIRSVPKRKVPAVLWYTLIHGDTPNRNSELK